MLVGGIYPAIVQQFQVRPNANEKEAPYIDRNIEATRAAYGINRDEGGKVNQQPYDATTDVAAALPELRADQDTIPNIRLLDPNILSPTFQQLQQIRNFYAFPSTLDVDRYTVDGKTRTTWSRSRELNSDNLTGNQRNWINQHTLYTHGYGFVAAAANEDLALARPTSRCGGLPATGPIKVDQPRIYFGELITDYSIVGAPTGGRRARPPGGSGGQDERQHLRRRGRRRRRQPGQPARSSPRSTRSATSCSPAPSTATRRSSTTATRRERVEKVAPWLTLDGDPYPAVVDGRILWIVDGYTTLQQLPVLAARTTLGEVTADSRTGQGTRALRPAGRSTTSATRSRRPSTRTPARSRCTSGTRRTRC